MHHPHAGVLEQVQADVAGARQPDVLAASSQPAAVQWRAATPKVLVQNHRKHENHRAAPRSQGAHPNMSVHHLTRRRAGAGAGGCGRRTAAG